MDFLSVREFRSSSRGVWQKLAQDGKLVLTNNGKPAVLMFDLRDRDFEDTLDTVNRIDDLKLIHRMQDYAAKKGCLSEEEIEAEIQAVRAEADKQKRI